MEARGYLGHRVYAYQDIRLDLPATQTYVLSGWAKANALPRRENERNPGFGLLARITYSDGTTEEHFVSFNPDIRAGTIII
jgi:hypothetical protein